MKNKKIVIISIVILVFLALLAFRIISNAKDEPVAQKVPVNVKTTTAQIQSIYATAPISGRIQPIEEVSVIPIASGQVTKVYAKLGDKVSVGTVLFEIDSSQLSTSYNQASDAYNSAKTNFDRMDLLYREGAISLQQYEQSKSQLITAQTSLQSLQDNLDNCIVKSPINGYVTSVNVTIGSMASGAGGTAVTVADISQLVVKTNVSEYLIGKIAIGDPVDIHVKANSDKPHKGTIKEISPAPAVGSLTYPITIAVENADNTLKAGMFAEIKIVSDKKINTLCIPSQCILIKNGESQVVSLEKNLPVFKIVTTGLDNGAYIEILSGLKEGDTVVVDGQNFIAEGEPVKVVK
ncbi:MAG: efflux RND transporter periplasmic adaptor subunit [Anaerovorax sp.]